MTLDEFANSIQAEQEMAAEIKNEHRNDLVANSA